MDSSPDVFEVCDKENKEIRVDSRRDGDIGVEKQPRKAKRLYTLQEEAARTDILMMNVPTERTEKRTEMTKGRPVTSTGEEILCWLLEPATELQQPLLVHLVYSSALK